MTEPIVELTTSQRDRLRRKRRLRKRLLVAAAAAALLALAYVLARPTVHALKAWQARRHAAKAFAFIDKQDWLGARAEAMAAYQLRPSEPKAVRAVARFLSRVGQHAGLEFWDRLSRLQPLTRDDLRDEARLALGTGDVMRAHTAIDALTNSRTPAAADLLLAAQLVLQTGARDEAESALRRVLADPHLSAEEELRASVMQIAQAAEGSGATSAIEDAWKRVERIAQTNRDMPGLEALVFLARSALSQTANAARPAALSNAQLADAIQAHPRATTPEKLLATDLRIASDSAQRETLIASAIAANRNAKLEGLTALASWLNDKGEFQRLLDTIPLEKAVQNRGLFVAYVDALAGLGRWADARKLLEQQTTPVDPVVNYMYLARCNAQLHADVAAENNWKRALEAAGDDAPKLMLLGEYAEKNGATDIATQAYDRAVAAAPKLRAARNAQLRIAHAARDTQRMHSILAAMLQYWPDDSAVQNDEAYTRLLLLSQQSRDSEVGTGAPEPSTEIERGASESSARPTAQRDTSAQEVLTISTLSEKLLAREPASLPHRTLLALARLVENRAADALHVYDNINVPQNVWFPSARAVHAAVLAANGNTADAKTEAAQIPPDALLPEERALIQPLL